MTALNILRYGLAIVLCVFLVRQLRSGRAMGEEGDVISREERPGTYWAIIGSEIFVIGLCLFLGAEE
jgi:hypothetical protein